MFLAVFFSLLEARLWPPSFPNVSLSLFLPLSLVLPFHWSLTLGVALGVLQQGIDPSVPWTLPLLYTLVAGSSRLLRSQFLGLGPWFTLAYFMAWSAAVKLASTLFGPVSPPAASSVLSALLTGLLASLLYWPWKRALE